MAYDEDQISTFVELASEIGIGRAQKELEYPKSWDTGRLLEGCFARNHD